MVLLIVVSLMRGRFPRDRRTLAIGALTGVLTVSLVFEGIAESTKLAGPGNSAVLTNTAPFFTVIFARAAFAQRTPRMAVGGLILGFTGVVVMVSSQLGGGSLAHVALGTTIALAAAAGFAVGALLIAHTAARQPNLDMLGFTAVQYVVGVLVLVLLVPIYGHLGRTDWGSGSLWGPVAWVSLGSSAAGSICFNLALRRISAARATGWQFLAPVVAVVVEAVLGNVPGGAAIVGMVAAIAGVAIVSLVRPEDSPHREVATDAVR